MGKVFLTPEATDDLLEIYKYILEREGEEQAELILNRLEERVYSLATLALRGKYPDELVPFGNRSVRELRESPWRIFYRPEESTVFVLSVLDGRRAIKEILENRLLR